MPPRPAHHARSATAFLCCAALAMAVATAARAQTAQGFGTVDDAATGRLIAGAAVVSSAFPRDVTTTDGSGRFSLPAVPSTTASFVDVTALGFVPTRFLVLPPVDDVQGLTFSLRPTAQLALENAAATGKLFTPFFAPAIGATIRTTPALTPVIYLDAAGEASGHATALGVSGGFFLPSIPAEPFSLRISSSNLRFTTMETVVITAPARVLVDLGLREAALVDGRRPSIVRVEPTVASNRTTTTLIVQVAGALDGAHLFVAGQELAVTSRSATELAAELPAGRRPGTFDVRVENPGGPYFHQLRGALTITGADDRNPLGILLAGAFDEDQLHVSGLLGARAVEGATAIAARTRLTTAEQVDNLRSWLEHLYQEHVGQVRLGGVDNDGRYFFGSPTLEAAGYPRGTNLTAMAVPEARRLGIRIVSPLEQLGAILLQSAETRKLRPVTTTEVRQIVRELAQQGVAAVDEERFDLEYVAAITAAARESGIEHIHFFTDRNENGTSNGSEEYLGYVFDPVDLERIERRAKRLASAVVTANTVGLGDLAHGQARELGRQTYQGVSGSFGSPPPYQRNLAFYRAATDRVRAFSFFPGTAEDSAYFSQELALAGHVLPVLTRLLGVSPESRPIANLILDVPASADAEELLASFADSTVPAVSCALRAAGFDVRPTFGRPRRGPSALYYVFTFGHSPAFGFHDMAPAVAALVASTSTPLVLHTAQGIPATGASTAWDALFGSLGLSVSTTPEVATTPPARIETQALGSIRWRGPDLASITSTDPFGGLALLGRSAVSSPGQVLATGEAAGAEVALIVSAAGRILINGGPVHLEAASLLANVIARRTVYRRPGLGYAFIGRQSAFLATEVEPFVVDVDIGLPATGSMRVTRFASGGSVASDRLVSGNALPRTTVAPFELLVVTEAATQSLPIHGGVNVLAAPLSTGPGFSASELARLAGAQAVSRIAPDAGGPRRFEIFLANGTAADFPVEPGHGYIATVRTPGVTMAPLEGFDWPAGSATRQVGPGIDLVGLPRGVPPGATAADIATSTGASFVARTVSPRGRFEVHIPGLTLPFPLEQGAGYVISVPGARVVTLPAAR